MVVPIILAGGTGDRLWPLSRSHRPKQLLPLIHNHSLLQQTCLRLKSLKNLAPSIIICNEEHRFIVSEQLKNIEQKIARVVLEPVGRNTAPAIAIAALHALSQGNDPLLLVLPTDHDVNNSEAFVSAIERGYQAAEAGKMVVFGVEPDGPSPHYGYIKCTGAVGNQEHGIEAVDHFIEKPDRATAERYLTERGYRWNSGIFLFRASRYLAELEMHAPAIATSCRAALKHGSSDTDFVRLDPTAFRTCPNESIDRAVMERTTEAVVVPLDAGWSDIGTWEALVAAVQRKDTATVTDGDVIQQGCNRSSLYSSGRLVVAIGVDDCIVVETDEMVLVAAKDRSKEIEAVLGRLRHRSRTV